MTPEQCKATRKRLGWTLEELAHRAIRGPDTVGDFERGKRVSAQTVLSIRRAFAEAGIVVDVGWMS